VTLPARTSPRTSDPLVEAARGLVPTIREASAEIEAGRRLPLRIVAALKEAGIIRMAMPRAWGGPEAGIVTQFRVIETLSMADASVGWCAYIGSVGGFFTAFLDQDVARTMYADLDAVTAGAAAPSGRAVVVDGGYRVSGRWKFGSGIQHADWVNSGCVVYDGDTPRLDAAGRPETCLCFLPPAACEIIDTWTTTGLRGSGSHDYVIHDAFVPAERVLSLATSPVRRPGTLYAYRRMFIFNHAAVALGIARASIDALIDLASAKTTGDRTTLRDEAYVQAAVARAETITGSARGYAMEVVRHIWDTLEAGGELSPADQARFRLAITHAHAAALETVDLVYRIGGGSSVYADSRLDRCLRDIHTISGHSVTSPKTYETAGRILLGLDSGTALF
jgi:alkylation response protein AidB-like acyl-CoA dehydrogenase